MLGLSIMLIRDPVGMEVGAFDDEHSGVHAASDSSLGVSPSEVNNAHQSARSLLSTNLRVEFGT